MTEHQKRADFVKRSFDVLFNYYSREPYRSRMDAMGQLGISTAVLDVVLNPETYVNIPTGEAASPELPFGDDSNHIGVVAVNPGEKVSLTVGRHPLQQSDVTESITTTTKIPDGVGASVYSPGRVTTFDEPSDAIYQYLRPTLFLPYEGREHEYSTVLIHELTHVAQMLMRSVRTYKDSESGELDRMVEDYNNELDAYQMQEDVFGRDTSDIIDFLLDATTGTSITVQSYRRRHLKNTGGYVTRENLDAIRRDMSVGPIVRRAFIKSE